MDYRFESDTSAIKIDDSTPIISEQAAAIGGEAKYYDFGKAEGNWEYFNPSIVERPDGIWLIVRRAEPHPQGFHFGQNYIWAFKMDDDAKTPQMGIRLKWMNHEPSQQFEDPRGFYHPRINQTIIGACTFIWYPTQPWTGAHQCIGSFDDKWVCQKMDYPIIGGNPGIIKRIEKPENYEKNWVWWLQNEQLHLLYKSQPWMVAQFGNTWRDVTYWKQEEGARWAYGDVRGGTTPVQVGKYYFTFHHSSLPWKGRWRRYYAGAIAYESKPPYRPMLITTDPLLTGSQNDKWEYGKPLVVFPCGALFKNDQWLVTLGVNDMRAAWMTLSHDKLMERMRPIGDVPNLPVFTKSAITQEEALKEKRRAQAAKARAALAKKRKLVAVK